jgi:hypothetical protein
MTHSPVSLDDLAEHVRDLRTVLCGLGYALGRQQALDAEQLRADLFEICLPSEDNPGTVATELATLLAQSIEQGKANSGRDRRGTSPGAD